MLTMTAQKPRKSLEPYLLDDVHFYPHQIEGVRKLLRLKSFLLADDMGLGKSLQALTVFCADVKTGAGSVAIVICPVSLRGNWADEIEKFTRIKYMLLGEEINPKTGKVKILGPAARSRQIAEFSSWDIPKILILNYEQVGIHLGEINSLKVRVAIFDEAHYIKNPEAVRTKACLKIKAERSFLLTGTPILNQVNELWSLFNRIAPGNFSNYHAFKNRYCVFGGYKNKAIVGVKNGKELQHILDQLMLRRLKKDVLDLKAPQYIQVKVDLSPLQRKLYDQAEDLMEIENIDPNADPMILENALTKFLRLKQICCTPATIGHPDESYKLDAVVERALEIMRQGEKLVIFTQFRNVLACVVGRLEKEGIAVYQLHGDIPKHERPGIVKNHWGVHPGPAVLACMLQVAGEGLNMIQAKTGFFIDKDFVPGTNRQAVDRMHRIGQQETQAVQIFEFNARNTIESRIEAILRTKMKLFDNVIEGAGVVSRLLRALQEADEK